MGDDYSVRLLRRLTHTPLALKDTLGDKLYDAYISSMLTPFSIDEVRLMERKTLYQVRTKCGNDKTFYRFGFNGQEKDNELKGKGNVNTAEFWQYDTRLGRRWNIDPVDQISISNYACFGNNPITNVDVKGDEFDIGGDKDKAIMDIRSWVPEKYQPLIIVSNDNKVQFDISQVDESDNCDAGIKLVYDLIQSKKKYIYEVKSENGGNPLRQGGGAYENNSKQPHMSFQTKGSPNLKEGYDGQVIIHPDVKPINIDNNGNEIEEPRGGFVYHEMKENFERTDNKKYYKNIKVVKGAAVEDIANPGAHDISIESSENLRPEIRSKYGKEGSYKKLDLPQNKNYEEKK